MKSGKLVAYPCVFLSCINFSVEIDYSLCLVALEVFLHHLGQLDLAVTLIPLDTVNVRTLVL